MVSMSEVIKGTSFTLKPNLPLKKSRKD